MSAGNRVHLNFYLCARNLLKEHIHRSATFWARYVGDIMVAQALAVR
jgi:hypothetical protein